MLPDSDQFLKKAKSLVVKTSSGFETEDLYIVWFAKVLGNWKALISTDKLSGLYWEVTYNGNKEEAYVDMYKKVSNVAVGDH